MLKFLIDAGADPLIRDSNGYTATKNAAINDSVILFSQFFFRCSSALSEPNSLRALAVFLLVSVHGVRVVATTQAAIGT